MTRHDDTSNNRQLHELTDLIVDDISEHIAPRLHAAIRERIRLGHEPKVARREEIEKVMALYQHELRMRYDAEPLE